MNVVENLENKRLEEISRINEKYAKKIAFAKKFGFEFLIHNSSNPSVVVLSAEVTLAEFRTFYDNFQNNLVNIALYSESVADRTESPFLLTINVHEDRVTITTACSIDGIEYRIDFNVPEQEYREVFTLVSVETDESKRQNRNLPKKYKKILSMNYEKGMSSVTFQGPYRTFFIENKDSNMVKELTHMLLYGRPNANTLLRNK